MVALSEEIGCRGAWHTQSRQLLNVCWMNKGMVLESGKSTWADMIDAYLAVRFSEMLSITL